GTGGGRWWGAGWGGGAWFCGTSAGTCVPSSIWAPLSKERGWQARMLAVEDAHRVEIGEQRERSAHVGMWDGIIVEVEADVGRLARDDHFALIDGIGVLGQGEEVWRLFGESLANGLARISGPAPIGSEAPAPGLGLRIEVVKIDK